MDCRSVAGAAGLRAIAALLALIAVGCGDSSDSGPEATATASSTVTPTATPSATGTATPTPVPTDSPSLVARGAQLFFNETFDGNGRTCGTCHPAEADFTLSPAFIATLPPDDPLFVAEREPALADLENPALMRSRGLILENIDGFDAPPVFRGVPHVFDLAFTAPYGWSDSVPDLREFSRRAVVQHFPRTLARVPGIDFRTPTDDELDALAAFMRSLELPQFIGPGVFPLTVALSPAAERGRDLFFGHANCSLCHSGVSLGGGSVFATGVTRLPIDTVAPPECNPPCPPLGPLELGGNRAFGVPPLVAVARTGPFFHDNAVATLREAVAFYTGPEFNASEGGNFSGLITLNDRDIDDITAFLESVDRCGNGVREDDEACDDGNRMPGDGCRSNCTIETCGDGIPDPQEQCDDGNRRDGDGCDAFCRFGPG